MKNLKKTSLLKITGALFILYLGIHYWPNISGFLGAVFSALTPLILGAMIAYSLNILMSFYERHYFINSKNEAVQKTRRPICLLLAMISLLAVLTLVILLIVPQIVSCIRLLLAEIPAAIDQLILQLESQNFFSEELLDQIAALDWQTGIERFIKTLSSGIGNVMDVAFSVVSTITSGVTTAFLAIVFSIYLLTGKDRLCAQSQRLMKRYLQEGIRSKINYVLSVMDECFHHYIVGQCTEAVILGTLCTVGMLILRLPYAPMIGATVAFTALLPVVGAYLGGAVGVFLICMESPVQAIVFLVFLVILQQVEGNLIYPRVVGSSIGLPGIWVLAAVTVGGGVGGIFGMLLGVPIAAAIYRLIREDIRNYELEQTAKDTP